MDTRDDGGQQSGGTPAGTTCLDYKILERLRGVQCQGRHEVFAHLVSLYLNDSKHLMQTMREALGAQDAAVIDKSAHRLKSSSASLGAHRLAALCAELESVGRKADLAQAADLLARAEHEHAAVAAALTDQLDHGRTR